MSVAYCCRGRSCEWIVASGTTSNDLSQTSRHHAFVSVRRTSGISVAEVYELYVRFSSTNNEPDEAGSDGPHEAILDSFMFESYADGPPKAVPVIQIDRLLADFAAAVGCCEFQRSIKPTTLPVWR